MINTYPVAAVRAVTSSRWLADHLQPGPANHGPEVDGVDDNGPGISSPENMLRPFAREGDQTTQGSGLGLAIVAEQLRRLPGRLELRASSRFSRGTEARVTIHRAARNPGTDTAELDPDV